MKYDGNDHHFKVHALIRELCRKNRSTPCLKRKKMADQIGSFGKSFGDSIGNSAAPSYSLIHSYTS